MFQLIYYFREGKIVKWGVEGSSLYYLSAIAVGIEIAVEIILVPTLGSLI